jgi:hypothetical protein
MNSHKGSEFKCEAIFNSHKEFNDYVKKRLTFAIAKSSLVNCTICKARNHKMRYKLGRCNDKSCISEYACEREIKLLYCQKRETVVYFAKGSHNPEYLARHPRVFGMPQTVKDKIEDLIYNYDTRPKRIHIKLEKLKLKKKIEKQHMPYLVN